MLSSKAISEGNYVKQAEAEFSRRNYDKAIAYYKKHLRENPRDFDAWNFLAASYYHSGQPEKALRYLKKVSRQSVLKSYNLFYQGLCYEVLNDFPQAKDVLTRASAMRDDYAAHAIHELAVIYYKEENKDQSLYWINQYLTRFPNEPFRNKLLRMRDSLTRNQYLPEVEGSAKPDMQDAMFRFHELSLLEQPHYWFYELGYEYQQGLITNPARDNQTGLPTVKKEGFANHRLLADAGFGLGPMVSKDATSYVGYHYYQYWMADSDRITTYTGEPTDIEYIPFRPDLLERHHEIYGLIKKNTNQFSTFGVFASYDVGRVGTSIFPVPGEQGIKKVLNVAKTTLLMPWFGLNYLDHYETRLYLFLRKELNEELPEFSNKTYNFLYESAEKTISFGLAHKMLFPQRGLAMNVDLYRYHFIYNDYWLDFTRTGLILTTAWDYNPTIQLNGVLGLYQDEFDLESIRTNSCSPVVSEQPVTSEVKVCEHADSGMLYQLGITWRLSQFKSISAFYNHVQVASPDLQVYEKSTDTINIKFTFAFPEVRQAAPFIGRYEDNDLSHKVY